MARAGIAKTKMLMLREPKRVDHGFHKLASNHQLVKPEGSINDDKTTNDSSSWVPHPRTGIYHPKCHEGVLNDVPMNVASFNQTYWLRNIDGVEKPDPDTTPDFYFHKNM